MARKARKSGKLTGAMRMRELGHRAVQLWLSPAEYAVISTVARADARAVATWVRLTVVEIANMRAPAIRELFHPPPAPLDYVRPGDCDQVADEEE